MQLNKVSQLKAMFPDMDAGVIASVLSTKGDDADKAIEALLSLNSTTLSEHDKKAAKKANFNEVLQKVLRMPNDSEARKLAGNFGLHVNTVAWEDTARTKGSSWGPCISDMTLMVEGSALPLVRYPNYEDLTWDVPMEKIPLVVGNEIGGKLYTISLKEYLEHFRMYLHNSGSWKGDKTTLLAPERDSHVIMSSQACFLPVPKSDEATFNVALYNYQSYHGNPAVLAITATSQGTSAQIVDESGWGGQKLYFNKNGQRASFVGQRLSDNRKERGVSVEGAMTQQEKQQNMVMIIQVPLKQKEERRRDYLGDGFGGGGLMMEECCDDMEVKCCSVAAPPSVQSSVVVNRSVHKEKADVEEAIIKIGEAEGEFKEIADLAIERDTRYPVRVTLQFYKSTANGVVDEESMRTIASQIEQSRKNADFVGSLVVTGDTGRPTEHKPVVKSFRTPDWWPVFWLTYGPTFSQFTEEGAKNLLFKEGRFVDQSLDTVKSQLLSILGGGVTIKPYPEPEPVVWNVLGGDAVYEE